MANAFYTSFFDRLMNKEIDMNTDDFKAILVDTTGDGAGVGYTFSAAHTDLDDISADDRVDTSAAFTTPTITAGVWDAVDVVFTAVAGTISVEAVVIFHDTPATEATKGLICYIDTAGVSLPVTTNGGDINLNWNGSGILKLSP